MSSQWALAPSGLTPSKLTPRLNGLKHHPSQVKELVYSELLRTAEAACPSDLSRFPALQRRLAQAVLEFIQVSIERGEGRAGGGVSARVEGGRALMPWLVAGHRSKQDPPGRAKARGQHSCLLRRPTRTTKPMGPPQAGADPAERMIRELVECEHDYINTGDTRGAGAVSLALS